MQALLDCPPIPRPNACERCAFIDFAFGGNDENVIAIRNGNRLEALICWRDSDSMATVGRIIVELSKAGLSASEVWGDEGGGGKVVCDALRQAGWAINRFNFGAKASNDQAFVSRGAEAWTNFGRQVMDGEIVLIRDDRLIAQLTSRQTQFDSRGRTKLESKEDMRSRGIKSPDRGDAVVGVFNVRRATSGNYLKAQGFVDSADPYTNWDSWGQSARDLSGETDGLRRHLQDTGAWTG